MNHRQDPRSPLMVSGSERTIGLKRLSENPDFSDAPPGMLLAALAGGNLFHRSLGGGCRTVKPAGLHSRGSHSPFPGPSGKLSR